MGQNAFRQALQDRTGLEPIMDARDSAVNSLHLAGNAGSLGHRFAQKVAKQYRTAKGRQGLCSKMSRSPSMNGGVDDPVATVWVLIHRRAKVGRFFCKAVWHRVFLQGARSKGGFGVLVTDLTAVQLAAYKSLTSLAETQPKPP